MSKRSFGSRSLQVATSVALCAVAIAARAEPFTLEAFCTVSSLVAGQGKCEVSWAMRDSPSALPTPARVALIKVNGVQAQWYVNDDKNPSDFTNIYGQTHVACGASYTVSALISKVGNTTYETVGSVPAVKCPTAP